jgi:hypothetical protein
MSRPVYCPPGAQVGIRCLPAPADLRDWQAAYDAFLVDIRREVAGHLPSFECRYAWRGRTHRVVARNLHADIGVSTLQGSAWVWLAKRSDREFRRRAEWIDAHGDAHRWLLRSASRFARLLTSLGCQQPPCGGDIDAVRELLAAA